MYGGKSFWKLSVASNFLTRKMIDKSEEGKSWTGRSRYLIVRHGLFKRRLIFAIEFHDCINI